MNFLVIDIGTSSCRAAVVSGNGKILSESRAAVRIDHPATSFAEIDLDRLWRVVQPVIRAEADKYPGITFDAIGVSAMLGYVFLDSADRPLMPAVTYADNRATRETEDIRQRVPDETFFAITGRRPSPLLLAPKIKWLQRHRPQTAKKLVRVIGLKDEIVRRLCGTIQTDVAHLDYSGLYNVYTGKPAADILGALGIKRGLLAAPAPATAIAGGLSAAVAARLGLTAGTPVISGSSDGTTAMYGAGILEAETAVLVSGTTDVLMRCCQRAPISPDHVLSVNSGMLPGTYLVGGPMGMSGGSLQYFEHLLQTPAGELEKKIAGLPAGADGLLIFPGLTGERAPYWKAHMTGAITGLTPNHQREHFLRAVMEGCALRMLKLLDILAQNGLRPRALNLVGGGAGSDAWNQIRSDVSGLEVRKPAVTEATCLGTALFCRAALDKARSLPEISAGWINVAKRYRPNAEKTRAYQKLARIFEGYLKINADLLGELGKFRR